MVLKPKQKAGLVCGLLTGISFLVVGKVWPELEYIAFAMLFVTPAAIFGIYLWVRHQKRNAGQ